MAKKSAQLGLTLVELLVGLAVGLVVLLVVTQIMQSFEGQKRTSTGGNDAQTNGAVALYMLQQEIRMGGYGLFGPEGALCPKGINVYHEGTGSGALVQPASSLVPARIVDGGGSNPDSIVTFRSSSSSDFGAVPLSIVKGMPTPSSIVTVGSDGGLQEGDLFIVGARDGSKVCTLMQLEDRPKHTGNGVNLNHKKGAYNPANVDKVFPGTSYEIGDIVIGFGGAENSAAWRFSIPAGCGHLVRSNALTITTPSCTDTVANDDNRRLVSQVVNLQAQYGIADGANFIWKDATGDWAALDADEVQQIRALRVAVVVRHPQYEKTAVSPATLELWSGGPQIGIASADRNYRHRVFETVIPLRNVIWSPAP
ncbi:PilW family protein [Thauera sp.]|uniref:PilW family protein n=1 Tax=Thauera sp. TaxID=1905334 RepID=UPI002619BD4C|nr:PilW family protein [Thauera sp.]MCK6408799.1 PilW family protein [Thauera sp.]